MTTMVKRTKRQVVNADTSFCGVGGTSEYLRKLADMLDEGKFEVVHATIKCGLGESESLMAVIGRLKQRLHVSLELQAALPK